MTADRLKIVSISHVPASPPKFGAQARIHGLMTELARQHEVTAIALVDQEFDIEECRTAMQAYCSEVILVPNPLEQRGPKKRLLQLRSLVSKRSFERLRVRVPEMRDIVNKVLRAKSFDIVNLEFSFLGDLDLRQAPRGQMPPVLVVDAHNIDYEISKQYARGGGSPIRRLYSELNWRKLRREELGTYQTADGVYLCSTNDEQRLRREMHQEHTAVIPNAADVNFFQPRAARSGAHDHTVLFFGHLSYVPNADGVSYFVREIWPLVAKAYPDARFKIIGAQPPASMLALGNSQIEIKGFVPDLRPDLAEAAVIVVPLRIGGGTRLKIVEGMAMGKAIVSTTLGAEGIEAVPGRDLFIEDQPAAFAGAINRLLADTALAARIGNSARQVAVERYAWSSAATQLEAFYRRIMDARASTAERNASPIALTSA